jgi:hypothetical protein
MVRDVETGSLDIINEASRVLEASTYYSRYAAMLVPKMGTNENSRHDSMLGKNAPSALAVAEAYKYSYDLEKLSWQAMAKAFVQ